MFGNFKLEQKVTLHCRDRILPSPAGLHSIDLFSHEEQVGFQSRGRITLGRVSYWKGGWGCVGGGGGRMKAGDHNACAGCRRHAG